MRGFNRISSISPNMVSRLGEKGVVSRKVVHFPNWVDIEAVRPLEGPNSIRRQLGIRDEQVVLLYSGNLGMKQGLDVLPPFAQHFRDDRRVHFIFCGDGAFRIQLERMTAGLRNVSMLPLQPEERLNELLNAADVHLLPQKEDAADLVMPSKLTGMLASGRPVISTAAHGTQVASVVSGRGINVPPGNRSAFHDAVLTLVANREMRRDMGRAARAFAEEHLSREQVLRRFEMEIMRLQAEFAVHVPAPSPGSEPHTQHPE
jgi:colanic acid biosynthesis glycosyl transferase WcaI